ncbi:MAG: cytidylate kinase-like family protein [Bacteroidales bacterium]|nr:cytidylate kinase-like family protein [Bacteroidales bacterium]
MEKIFIITIGRQIGSGGLEIAQKLSDKLGVKMYDKELLNIASRESGLRNDLFEKKDEKIENGLKGVLGSLLGIRGYFADGGAISLSSSITEEDLFTVQSAVIKKIASENSSIFIGRCADYILRDYPTILSVFISAEKKFRIARLMDMRGITQAEALKIIDQLDKERAAYYNYYTFKKWGDASSYHLCIDSSKFGIDGAVEMIFKSNFYNINSI